MNIYFSDLAPVHSSSEEMCAVCNLSECLLFHFPLANERTPNLTIVRSAVHYIKRSDVLTSFCFVCLFVYSHTSNFSAIWWLSPLPVTGLQI
jgi:hypothetical protein